MYDVRVERSAGYAGIAFIITVIVAGLLPGFPPPPDATIGSVDAFLVDHHATWLVAGWLVVPESVFFLWFVVQLRAYLRLVPQIDDGLPTYLLIGGIFGGIVAVLAGMDQILLGFRPPAYIGDPAVQVLYDAFNCLGTLIFIPTMIMTFAASQSGRRHGSLPSGLVVTGYVATAGAALSTLTVFWKTGVFAMGGIATIVLGLLPFSVWIVWASLVLIRAPRSGQSGS